MRFTSPLLCIVSHPFRALLVGALFLAALGCEESDPTEESVDAIGSTSGAASGSAGQGTSGSPVASTAGATATGASTQSPAVGATDSAAPGNDSDPVSDVTSGATATAPPGTSTPDVPTAATPGADAAGAGGAGGSAAVTEDPAGEGGAPAAGGSSGMAPSQGGAGGSATGEEGLEGAGGVGGGSGEGSGGLEGAGGSAPGLPELDPTSFAAGFHELMIHDACTADYPPQPDTCLHEQELEQTFTFGGDDGITYDVTLRVRGLFEPTTVAGGETPDAEHPYFKVGGSVTAVDYSQWHIVVSEPAQTYWLNHYPQTSHTIYAEDFEVTIPVSAGAEVAVRVVDGNDRQIDNAEEGLADRRQLIEGVTPEVLDGQVLRIDVLGVAAQ